MAQTASARLAQKYAEAKKPPKLRESEDGLRSCATCSAFDLKRGACLSFGSYPVTPILTCDSWHVEED
jgi:hypothetical protein